MERIGFGVRCLKLVVNILVMATIKRFEDLEIWKEARIIENKIFKLLHQEKLSTDFALRNQMNNSSGSIMDNIAEGFGRASRLEFINFLSIAKGSAVELQSQLYRCLDRQYFEQKKFDDIYLLIDILCKKISSMMNYLNQTEHKGQKFYNRKKI